MNVHACVFECINEYLRKMGRKINILDKERGREKQVVLFILTGKDFFYVCFIHSLPAMNSALSYAVLREYQFSLYALTSVCAEYSCVRYRAN